MPGIQQNGAARTWPLPVLVEGSVVTAGHRPVAARPAVAADRCVGGAARGEQRGEAEVHSFHCHSPYWRLMGRFERPSIIRAETASRVATNFHLVTGRAGDADLHQCRQSQVRGHRLWMESGPSKSRRLSRTSPSHQQGTGYLWPAWGNRLPLPGLPGPKPRTRSGPQPAPAGCATSFFYTQKHGFPVSLQLDGTGDSPLPDTSHSAATPLTLPPRRRKVAP